MRFQRVDGGTGPWAPFAEIAPGQYQATGPSQLRALSEFLDAGLAALDERDIEIAQDSTTDEEAGPAFDPMPEEEGEEPSE